MSFKKTVAIALVTITAMTSQARADFNDLLGVIVGGIILNGIVEELSRDHNPRGNTHDDNLYLYRQVTKRVPIYEDTNRTACEYRQGYKLFGYYDSQYNYIMICDGLNYNEKWETIRHETAHMVQDCMTHLSSDTMDTHFSQEAIMNQYTDRTHKWLESYRNLDNHSQWLEAEAFTMEVWPSREVARVVNQRCTPKWTR